MKILFVDDEPMVLSAMERALFDTDWDIHCVTSGDDALDYLADNEVDFVVSDMRMPGKDGAELLEDVYNRYPDAVRIVLSGHADKDASSRASLVAHQWLDKPCKPEVLRSTLEKIDQARQVLPKKSIREIVGRTKALPSPPRTYARLREVLDEKTHDINDIAAIISEDPALTAKVLQLVNSSFFLRMNSISDVAEAVVRLGEELVSSVVLMTETYAKLPNVEGYSLADAQTHCVNVGRLAARLVGPEAKQNTMLAGLLHDVGQSLLFLTFPEVTRAFMDRARDDQDSDTTIGIEQEIYGVDHAQIGAYLLHLWGFPYPLVEGVAFHHMPLKMEGSEFGPAAGIHAADRLLRKQALDAEFVERFSVADKLPRWEKMANDLID